MDRPFPSTRAFPGVLQALALLAGAFALMLAFGCGAGAVQMALGMAAGGGPGEAGAVHPALTALANLLALGIAVGVGVWITRRPVGEVLPLRGFSGWLVLPMALTVLGISVVMSEGDNLLRSVLPMPAAVARVFEQLFSGEQSVWGTVLLVVIVAPLTEETLFRGVILRGFLLRYRRPAAYLASAALFAAFHANPWQLAAPLSIGLVLAWWMFHTRSLWPCLLAHAMNNGIPVTLQSLGIEVRGYTTAFSADVVFQPWWFDLAGLAALGIGLGTTALVFRSRSRSVEWDALAQWDSGGDGAVPAPSRAEDVERGALEGGGLPAAGIGDPGVGGGPAVEDQ